MAKSVGRKVYRTNVNYRKRKVRNAAKFILFLIFIAALVFLGYCIANPVFEYFSDRDGEILSAEDTRPWTPPAAPDESIDGDDSGDSSQAASGEEQKRTDNGGFSAYRLPVSSLASTEALNDALSYAKEGGYTAVIAVLKDEGGKIYYKTGSEMAQSDETAIVGELYSGQICSIIRAAGFTTIAEVNLLEDNNRYGEKRDGSYHFASDDSTWLDNSVANGGKPWLSPFDTNTQSFAAYLSNEISSAGFDYIIFDGLSFPNFRNSDLAHIGAMVQAADRYKALINIENISVSASEQNGSVPVVMTSAGEILGGTAEVFKPSELTSEIIAVTYQPSEISGTIIIGGQEIAVSDLTAYEMAETIFGEIKRLAGEDKTIVPAVKQSDFSQADFNDVISATIALGLESYIIL